MLMLSNCGVGEDSWESPLDTNEIKRVNPKGNQCWIFTGRTDAEAEAPILWLPDAKSWLIGNDPDAGKDWRQEEKGMTGWDGWMASPTQWTWVWASSGRWWWTGKPDVLQSMGLQRVRHDWATEQHIHTPPPPLQHTTHWGLYRKPGATNYSQVIMTTQLSLRR